MMTETYATHKFSILVVHAHPDDETISTGGLLARCADAGAEVRLVVCTDGRHGPVNPELELALSPVALADIRRQELQAAATLLGVTEVIDLGYHDSGMSPADHAAASFCAAPLDAVIGRLVAVIRSSRPHIVITYDPVGATFHPDHVQAHRVTVLAVSAAAEPAFAPESGDAWGVGALFFPVFPRSAMESFIAGELAEGRAHPFAGRAVGDINYVRPDNCVTHRVDIASVYERKCAALRAHRTQIGPHNPNLAAGALARRHFEHFRLAQRVGDDAVPTEIFEPVAP